MRIPVAWLREFVAVPEERAELEAFADVLTMAGLEVEEILETPVGPTFFTKITPNRGDWASIYGTAREAAAALKLPLAALPATTGAPAADVPASVTIEDGENCPRYAAKIIRNVKVGETPAWMQERLYAALGDKYKPINNLVDITNYVMLELGQPLHAFDLETLPEGKIVVRQARPGERLTTLDEIERALEPGMLCICDHEKPVAVAGIMGGAPTEITEKTVNVLLESAHFDMYSVRRTAKRLGLKTEASYRFERFVDPQLVPVAAERAAQLMVEIAGGEAVPGLIDVKGKPMPPRRVVARMDRVRKLLGADVDRDEAIAALERLGVSVERSAGAMDCVIPSWRVDLNIEDDIAEEVGRIALGYADLPETEPPVYQPRGTDSPRGIFFGRVREALVRAGLTEVQSHSLVAPFALASEEERAAQVAVRLPLAPEHSVLRQSLLPNLFTVAARALGSGIRDIALFEVGPVYQHAENGEGYIEPVRVSGVVAGSAMPQAWSLKGEAFPADFYFAKGVVEDLCAALGMGDVTFAPTTHPLTHSGRTAGIYAGGEQIGVVAELSAATIEAEELPRRACIFNLDGDVLLRHLSDRSVNYAPLPRFPAVVRDLAPVFPVAVSYAEIEKAATEAAGTLLQSLRLTDIYTGASLGEGMRALTLRFTFRSPERTLKDTEVESALQNVREALTRLGGEFRA
ncbi:MAG: phenylalanine--tRNA ligase subunit beta [Armatimonadaceae bacterium]